MSPQTIVAFLTAPEAERRGISNGCWLRQLSRSRLRISIMLVAVGRAVRVGMRIALLGLRPRCSEAQLASRSTVKDAAQFVENGARGPPDSSDNEDSIDVCH